MSGSDAPPPARVADLIVNSIAPNTRRAYASDLLQFEGWGGSIPATPVVVAAYLAEHADAPPEDAARCVHPEARLGRPT
jgi:hypothetical protein